MNVMRISALLLVLLCSAHVSAEESDASGSQPRSEAAPAPSSTYEQLRASLAKGDSAAALRDAKAWVERAPNEPQAWGMLGVAYESAGRPLEAYRAYIEAINRIPPGHPALELEQRANAALAAVMDELPTLPPGNTPFEDAPASSAPVVSKPATASEKPASPPPSTIVWAATARASTEYGLTDWGANQATGAPNSTRHADDRKSWASRAADAGEEWIELSFPGPVSATGLRIVQNFNPGALMKIEAVGDDGTAQVLWSGPDSTSYEKNQIGIFETRFSKGRVSISRIRVALDTKRIPGWNEIDAVGLLTE